MGERILLLLFFLLMVAINLLTVIFRRLMGLEVIHLNLLLSCRILSSLVLSSVLLRTVAIFDLSALRIIMSGWFLSDLAVLSISGLTGSLLVKSRCLVASALSRSGRLLLISIMFCCCMVSNLEYRTSSSNCLAIALNFGL